MQLRTRFKTEIRARLVTLLPQAVETVWDTASTVVMSEQLKFVSAGGADPDHWERRATVSGIMALELRANTLNELPVEPLIANLIHAPVYLAYDPTVAVGDISENARFVLEDWRDAIRDTNVATKLRFSVEGTLAKRVDISTRPDLLIGQAPNIGPGHLPDYTQIESV
jgi:hypothetical protein